MPRPPTCLQGGFPPFVLLLLFCFWMPGIQFVQAQDDPRSAVVCYTPGNLNASAILTNQVTLSWVDQNGATKWELEVRTGNQPFFGTPTHLATSNPYLLNNLNPATSYRVRIRAICNNGMEMSGWSFFTYSFTTASYNPTNCGLYFKIDDDNCPIENTFNLKVNNQAGTQLGKDIAVTSVDVILRHTFLADLHLTLVSPSGQSVVLFEEHGQSRDHLGNPADPTCQQVCRFSSLDCQAINPVEHASNFIGTFQPDEPLNGFNDGSDPAGIWQLKICDDAKADTGSLRYVHIQFGPLTCPPAFDLNVTQLSPSTADVLWSHSGNCDQVVLEYGAPGFIPGNGVIPGQGTIVTVPCGVGQIQLNGLTHSTAYDLYIRTICTGGGSSANSCPVAFTTDCEIGQQITLVENFDGLAPCGGNCFCDVVYPLNSFWDNRTTGDDFDWLVRNGPATVELQTGPFSDVKGNGNYLYLETLNTACQKGATAILQSGCLVVQDPPGEECHMSFYYHMWGQTMGTLEVDVTLDGGASWSPVWSTSGNQGSRWHKIFLDLSPFAGDTIQIRFQGISGSSRTSQMALDEISLYGLTVLGEPDIVYYLDQDSDGFGDADSPFFTCSSVLPSGYSRNALDCNDQNANIYPGAMEITCNQIDENCNGMNDDSQAPLPVIENKSICRGTSTIMTVSSPPFGQIFWYDLPVGGNPIHVGPSFQTPNLNQSVTYYLADSSQVFPCESNRKAVQIIVTDQPNLNMGVISGLCQGDTIDLKNLPISDLSLSASSWTYHSASPATPANKLSNTKVVPLISTTYFLLAQTDFGCMDELPIPIQVWSKPVVSIINPDPLSICAGESELLQAQITNGGLGPFQFSWSTGFSQFYTPVIAGNMPGSQTFKVTATDSRGCKSTDTQVVVTLAGIPGLTIGTTDVTSCGGSNGSITVSPQSGGAFNYAWSGPVPGSAMNKMGSFIIPALKQGSYSLTLTNPTSGCTISPAPIVVNGPGPTINAISYKHETCVATNDGSITLDVSGAVSGYAWSHGPTTQNVSGLQPGNYQVTVTGGGCNIVLQNLVIKAAKPMDIGGLVQAVHCFGEASGSIDLALNGGLPPYSFLWNSGQTSQNLAGIVQGNYWVTITDTGGCTYRSDTFIVTQPLPLLASHSLQQVTCYGLGNGSIQLLITGGTLPYKVLWSDMVTTKDRSMLSPGSYSVTVSDQKNCAFSISNLTITEKPALSAGWLAIIPETCSGAGNGQMSIQVTGGTSPYTYQWNFGTGQSVATGLNAGKYAVTITDAAGCVIALPETDLSVSNPLIVQQFSLQDPTCDFLHDGSIQINVTGGSGNYAYLWTNNQSSNLLTNVASGNYSVTVTDLLGCSKSISGLILKENSPLDISLVGIQYAACGLSSTGDIDIAVTGTGPFVFNWQNGFNGEDPKAVPPGFYAVTVTDVNLCRETLSGILVSNTGLSYKATLIQREDLICHGDHNGLITVQVEGGEPPYQFNWSSGQEKDLTVPIDGIQGLDAGNYSVTITDNRGCVLVYGPITIDEPLPLDLGVPPGLIKNVSCLGAKDGAITLNINGGVPPYKTFWFRDSVSYSTAQSPMNLRPGKYTAIIVDKHGCTKALTQEITILGPPSLFTYQSITVTPDDCSEAETGTLEIKMTGGVQDYQYLWADGFTGKTRENLAPGSYCVTIQDQYQCVRDTCISVPGGSTLVMIPTAIDECDPNSKIYTNTGGGTPPYTYKWSTGSTAEELIDLPTGTYSVTITDKDGCSLIESGIDVGYPPLWIGSLFSVPADPGQSNGMAIVVPQGGTPPYSIQWDANTLNQMSDTASALVPSTYCVQITDVNNCVDTGCVLVMLATSFEQPDLGLEDVHFQLNPNPTSNRIRVQIHPDSNPWMDWNLQLFNSLGQQIQVWQRLKLPSDLHLDHVQSGYYYLIGQDSKGNILSAKVLVN